MFLDDIAVWMDIDAKLCLLKMYRVYLNVRYVFAMILMYLCTVNIWKDCRKYEQRNSNICCFLLKHDTKLIQTFNKRRIKTKQKMSCFSLTKIKNEHVRALGMMFCLFAETLTYCFCISLCGLNSGKPFHLTTQILNINQFFSFCFIFIFFSL